MNYLFNKVIVTGGAGFIGSHIVDYIVNHRLSAKVVVIDNLSSGSLNNISSHIGQEYFEFINADLKKFDELWTRSFREADLVIHMAANPEVRLSVVNPEIHFNENILATFNVLEASRIYDVKIGVFASSSTVYGDAKIIPTPEDYHPLEPISVYGGAKLCAEVLYITYSKLYGLKSLILRYANIIGPRSNHGVIIDFINKLKKDPTKLEILGDGTQRKSYLHVYDAVDATMFLTTKLYGALKDYEIFNVGNEDWITVKEIADIVVEEMNLKNVEYIYKLTTRDGRGWPGDVKLMLLDIRKLKSLGWTPSMTSAQAVRKTVRQILGKE
ncbi:NAD-dependent epimerase/dehydratase [Ignisphaera aggregans DSM 17230]|uniref:NAD-dependent epimerase/dehydratase n=1 Tax=Ignisphaera aggregans (strain DSM 17230 / JCM 13409 / AQ1.S1) TaxID=583356 RepID=E0SQJ6_IGNAA|nr:NAD-dependent epimerase/dehydratase [Ignisphaera aggregans DSM 17230]